jgi:isohexenylglutaconyl-CoA hydratase
VAETHELSGAGAPASTVPSTVAALIASDPSCLRLCFDGGVLHVELHRPEVRNAMSLAMVSELEATLAAAQAEPGVRAIVLRGAGGHFCAGGDVKDMAGARGDGPAGIAAVNRAFGRMITAFDAARVAVIALLEGTVMGGGFGLSCVADVAIATADASFRLPEVSLGVPPAQIAPFLVQRLGLSQARRLAVSGGRLDGRAALAIGLVHEVVTDAGELIAARDRVLADVLRGAPGAIATTKALLADVGRVPHEALLDRGAAEFGAAAFGPEGSEGMLAFVQKRPAAWMPPSGGEGRR